MIEAAHLIKKYGNLTVLNDVSLTIPQGQIVSIVGRSGAGKSTLLHILGTLDVPDAGMLKIAGVDIAQLSERKRSDFRNNSIGFVFQFHHLLPEFTALENVCIPAFIKGERKAKAEARAKDLLAFLGLAERVHHKPSQLSGGEQQRVAVARALINQPAAVFADEPSGNLDTQTSEELHQLFFKLRDQYNQTFVIVTHNEDLAGMADRKIVMRDGVIVS